MTSISRAQFSKILIRENSEKNDWPLKFLPVVPLAPAHPWTKFGPNRSLLTQVMVAFQTDRQTEGQEIVVLKPRCAMLKTLDILHGIKHYECVL